MEKENLPVTQEISIVDDFLIQVAEHAERRIEAVIKIKQVALKVTNVRDWTDQQGNPYLQVSGSEKIANLFNISWRIDEPTYEEDPDGHYTYTFKGYFSLAGRTIEAEGSRSSRDAFFVQYKYKDEKGNKLQDRQEVPVSERTNKRDVKMAALTNLLGNGITRLLGIRNLTWEDLAKYAQISKEQVTAIQYKKGGEEPIHPPQKKNGDAPKEASHKSIGSIQQITQKTGKKGDGNDYTLYTITAKVGDNNVAFKTFSKTMMEQAKNELNSGLMFEIGFEEGKYGNDLVSLSPVTDGAAQ